MIFNLTTKSCLLSLFISVPEPVDTDEFCQVAYRHQEFIKRNIDGVDFDFAAQEEKRH